MSFMGVIVFIMRLDNEKVTCLFEGIINFIWNYLNLENRLFSFVN